MNPHYFERIKIPVVFPFLVEEIQVILMESNLIKDVEVAKIIFNLNKTKNGDY